MRSGGGGGGEAACATAAARGGDPCVRLATELAHDDRRIAAGSGDTRAELGARNIRF